MSKQRPRLPSRCSTSVRACHDAGDFVEMCFCQSFRYCDSPAAVLASNREDTGDEWCSCAAARCHSRSVASSCCNEAEAIKQALCHAGYQCPVVVQIPGSRAHVGHEVAFATKPDLARRMLERPVALDLPAGWVTGDTAYGGSRPLHRWRRSCMPDGDHGALQPASTLIASVWLHLRCGW
jgi:hypothetical protein